MANKNFLLLSMEDEKIKKISNVISNESCRKILDCLSAKEASESELAEKLGIPISTVHYNLQQLMETGLIDSKEFHYSKKGKEVNHYKLANKYIIIAPKKTFGIKEKLKSILPVALIIGAITLVLQYTQRFFGYGSIKVFTDTKQTLVRETVIQKAAESAPMIKEAASAATAMPSAVQNITNKTIEYALNPQVTTQTVTAAPSIWQNIALWFLLGALFALVIYFVFSLFRKNTD